MSESTTQAAQRPAPVGPIHHRYLPGVLRLSPTLVRADVAAVDGFNAKVAVLLTKVVGTMWCFYVFNGIALISLPSALHTGQLTIIINWVSSNWIQLILLPALMVGQNVQSAAADARAVKTFNDTEEILNRLDVHTEGGLKAILDAIEELKTAR
ncbi:MAG TPA: hypothetical protein VFN55_17355 [Solirubrobacteraceae bacterium]|nr:hypothetical protein [Solirubrobacteraceae bacterium]